MSHHLSGPRAAAEPVADITDLYAFPSPEHPGRLVLVLNTLPFAPPSALFSDGLIYRFRLRPLTASDREDGAPFAAGGEEIVIDCTFSAPPGRTRRGRPGARRHVRHAGGRDGLDQGERRAWRPGTYLLFRIDDRGAGRTLVQRLLPVIESARSSSDPARNAWVSVAFTYQGLKALGVPQDSLDSFAPEFRRGMAARAAELGDAGDSGPENWEKPLGSPEVHVAVSVVSPGAARLDSLLERARRAHEQLPGVRVIWRQDCYQLPTGRTSFGFRDGIGQPAVEGSGIPGSNPGEPAIKAGEFILGYPDETGSTGPVPVPEVLGRNGTYLAFRKLHTRVAAYRQYLRAKAASREEEALLGAKMAGRWQSGAPLALCPDRDDPDLGADPGRNNRFGYEDDLRGFKCPAGAHARRANPRDALDHEMSADVRLHRMLRLGTNYGPMLPEGVLEDDGADRGIVFVFAGAHPKRQFEFVKTQWLNDGIFIGAPAEKDPLAGANDGSGTFTIPRRPIRRRLQNLPPFVITRGGEYCFAPGLRALRWLAELDTRTG